MHSAAECAWTAVLSPFRKPQTSRKRSHVRVSAPCARRQGRRRVYAQHRLAYQALHARTLPSPLPVPVRQLGWCHPQALQQAWATGPSNGDSRGVPGGSVGVALRRHTNAGSPRGNARAPTPVPDDDDDGARRRHAAQRACGGRVGLGRLQLHAVSGHAHVGGALGRRKEPAAAGPAASDRLHRGVDSGCVRLRVRRPRAGWLRTAGDESPVAG
eukprot:364738-Chlamydomonas_euryale.AAC.3